MIETGKDLAAACRDIAEKTKTIYALGSFGWPMNDSNKNRTIAAYAYNRQPERQRKIEAAAQDAFAFDCVGLIKGLLWGWNGNTGKTYGGAVYVSNGVPDKNANQMIGLCGDVSEDFAKIQTGEAVWLKGHIGVYIGSGLVVECTPKWDDGVQITALYNMGKKDGFHGRFWTSHGKLPWLRYENSYCLELPMLSKGCRAESVRALQQLLIANGFGCGCWGADGDFGDATELAVVQFQNAAGLTADGVAGPQTMGALLGVKE